MKYNQIRLMSSPPLCNFVHIIDLVFYVMIEGKSLPGKNNDVN